jgi:NitT/TauT family transport system substrate-binding protein
VHRSFTQERSWPNRRCILGLLSSVLSLVVSIGSPQAAESKNVRIILDWLIQGTHAPFFVAQDKGYFKAEGVTVESIDPGKGATNTAVSVASGVYQFGFVDLPAMIRFNAQNPTSPLIAVYMSFDDSPASIVTLKSRGINKPADLNGKKLAGGPGTAVHDTISILLHAAGAENVHIEWVAVSPQLYAPMLKRGEVDGIGAFTNAQIPALLDLGFKREEIAVLKYSDFGADLYGLALVTTKKFADQNPETVRGVVKALNRGTKDTIANPDAALQIMKARDGMMKVDMEKVRLLIVIDLMATPHVQKEGLSSVIPEKLKKTIGSTVTAYQLPATPEPSGIYSDRFLPPSSERVLSPR